MLIQHGIPLVHNFQVTFFECGEAAIESELPIEWNGIMDPIEFSKLMNGFIKVYKSAFFCPFLIHIQCLSEARPNMTCYAVSSALCFCTFGICMFHGIYQVVALCTLGEVSSISQMQRAHKLFREAVKEKSAELLVSGYSEWCLISLQPRGFQLLLREGPSGTWIEMHVRVLSVLEALTSNLFSRRSRP